MAKAPPQHKRPSIGKARRHKAPRKQESERRRGSSSARGYDKKWERFRVSFLLSNPLCEYCLANGETVPAKVVDHDLPHEGDPELFWDNTFTSLCGSCHNSTKQRMERRYSGDDLLREIAAVKSGARTKRTRIDTVPNAGAVLVWGPPCGGKTTWAKAEADKTGAVLYDLDDIAVRMGLSRYSRTKAQARLAGNQLMRDLSQHPAGKRLLLIATAPTQQRRRFWAGLVQAHDMRLVTATQAECKARAKADPQRARHYARQVEIITDWFEQVD